jgi:hypothetical protein
LILIPDSLHNKMLPIIFVIIAAVFVYRTAKSNGHKPVLWTVIAVVAFLGVQIGIGLAAGLVIVLGTMLWGWSPFMVEGYGFLISIVALVPAIGVVMLVLRHVNKVKDDAPLRPRSATSIFDDTDVD